MNGFFRFCYYSKVALIPPIPLIPLSIVSNKLITTSDNLLQLTIYRLLHLGVVIRVSFTIFQKQEKEKERPQESHVVRLKEKKSERAAVEEPRCPLKRRKERKSGRRRSHVVRLKEKKSERAAAGELCRPLKRKKERKSGRRRIASSA